MTYEKTIWVKDETPLSPYNMNHIEQGIFDAQATADTTAAGLVTHDAKDATTAAKGHVQLATAAEVTAGTNTTKAVTPAGAKVELDKKVNNSLATAANQFLLSTGIGAWAVKTATEIRNALGLGNTTGALPIANGGTGATTAAGILTAAGVTATAAELNYMDGVTSNVQTQLNGKAASSHNHSGTYEPADANIMKKNVAQTMAANLVANGGTDYGTAKARNIYAGTSDMTPGVTALTSGALYVMYE